jgi:hypothetical protein
MDIEIESQSDENPVESTKTYVFDIEREMHNGQTCAGIIRVLSDVMDSAPNAMKPLHSVVNCDALDALFRTRRYGESRDNVSITFTYEIYDVTVDASGQVVVSEG